MSHRVLGTCLAIAALLAASAAADEIATAARTVAEKYDAAAVTLKITSQQSYSDPVGGTEHEDVVLEVPGVIVDAQGTTVTAMSVTDPSAGMERLWSESDEQEPGYSYSTRITLAKILLQDGKELGAKVILTDRDLDLAVFQPNEAPAQPMPFVDLAEGAPAERFDPVLILQRLGKLGQRANAGFLARVAAKVTKPRAYWVVPGAEAFLGAPVFTEAGKPLGIVTIRLTKSAEDFYGYSDLNQLNAILPIVIPAADIAEVVAQAKASPDPNAGVTESKPVEAAPADGKESTPTAKP